jgi:hypothetical protein
MLTRRWAHWLRPDIPLRLFCFPGGPRRHARSPYEHIFKEPLNHYLSELTKRDNVINVLGQELSSVKELITRQSSMPEGDYHIQRQIPQRPGLAVCPRPLLLSLSLLLPR